MRLRHVPVDRIWLIDGEKDDDLAVLDLTDEVEHSAIDLDGDERVKFATSDQFEGLGIKRGCKAFSVCGSAIAASQGKSTRTL